MWAATLAAGGNLDEVDGAVALAEREKVLLPAALGAPNGAPAVDRLRRHLFRRRALLLAAAEALGALTPVVPAVAVKGAGVEAVYPEGHLRQAADVDLAVPSGRAMWGAIAILAELGFGLQSLVLRRDGSALRGAASMSRGPVHLEVLGGALPLNHRVDLPLDPGLWERTETTGALPVPTVGDRLAIQLGELLERRRLIVRDAFDVAYLAAAVPDADLARVRRKIREHALRGQLDRVAEFVELDAPATVARRLLPAVRRFSGPQPRRTGGHLRSVAASHVYPRARRGAGRRRAAATAASAAGWELAGRALARRSVARMLTPLDARLDARRRLESGMYVQLVVIAAADPAAADELRWRRTAAGAVVETPAGRCLASPLGLATPRRLRTAAAA